MKKLAIIGAGDLGKHIAHYAKQSKLFEVVGFYDDFEARDALVVGNAKVLGKIADVYADFQEQIFDELLIGLGSKQMALRKKVFEELHPNITFANLIHQTTYIDESCVLGKGIVILPNCTLDKGVKLGNNIFLNVACSIAHDTTVGKHSFFAPAVKVAGFTNIGRSCIFGIGTIIADHVKIADETQSNANATILNDIEDKGLYAGSPARKIK